MSRFLEALRMELTDRKKACLEPLSVVATYTPELAIDIRTMQECDFRIEWRVKAFCAPKDRQHMLKNVYREVQEAVYGHLRDRLLMLERAIYEEDQDKVRMHLRDLFAETEK